jgi:hypothetical protein
MARTWKLIGAGLLISILSLSIAALWLVGLGNVERMVFVLGITYNNDAPRLPELKQPAILIFSKTNGFRDNGQIEAANVALEKLAHDKGWASYTTENAAIFNARQLWQFKAVVWDCTARAAILRINGAGTLMM